MAYTKEQVELLQGEVIDQSNEVFDAMKILADDATAKALDADLTVDTSGLPNAPVYSDVDLHVEDFNAALAFLASLRNGLLATPVYPADYTETTYSSALLVALVNLLYSDLINGGYGIDPNDEENLWNRAREREIRSMQSQQDSSTRQFAALGSRCQRALPKRRCRTFSKSRLKQSLRRTVTLRLSGLICTLRTGSTRSTLQATSRRP